MTYQLRVMQVPGSGCTSCIGLYDDVPTFSAGLEVYKG